MTDSFVRSCHTQSLMKVYLDPIKTADPILAAHNNRIQTLVREELVRRGELKEREVSE